MRQRSSRPNRASFGAGRRPPTVSALSTGVRLVSQRAHSRVELRRKLGRRGYPADEIEAALSRLVELGYLNDLSFAEGLVRHRSASRGPRALSAELAARGVQKAAADAAVAGFDPEAQLASATVLAERLYARKPASGYREMLDRVGSKLMRRGFSATTVRAACWTVLSRTSEGTEDLAPPPDV
ncbi:MAG TPA: regulatory protein RecX [Candidatus Dormibacteraeota bacterium]|nr:regulatory protein RecX [Candidatus Dormibacteraeota bacterium]